MTNANAKPTTTTITRHEIIGTNTVVFEAWEPYRNNSHSTITRLKGEAHGRIGTRRLPTELDALPAYSDERLAAVTGWQQDQYDEAYAAILDAFPFIEAEADSGEFTVHRSMGSIDVTYKG
jgi:hypothetical protein